MPARDVNEARPPPHWDEYWSSGLLHSCHDAFPGNYADRIAAAWHEVFRELPREARVLDLCAGNGALALLADDYARERGLAFEVHALDAARVHPERTRPEFARRLERIRFRQETPAERTGYPDASFDAVIGQFAIEYTNVADTCLELERIVRPGGVAAFVAHHRASVIVAAASREADRIDFLLSRERVLEAARRLIEAAGRLAGPGGVARLQRDSAVDALRTEFNAVSGRVTARIASDAAPGILRFALGQVSLALKLWQNGDAAAALTTLTRCEQALAANRARLADLLGVAWRDEETQVARRSLETAGFERIAIDALADAEGRLLGWLCVVRRVRQLGSAQAPGEGQ